jgi:hypothetical protein
MTSTASLLTIEAHSSTPLVLVSGYDRVLHREYVIKSKRKSVTCVLLVIKKPLQRGAAFLISSGLV